MSSVQAYNHITHPPTQAAFCSGQEQVCPMLSGNPAGCVFSAVGGIERTNDVAHKTNVHRRSSYVNVLAAQDIPDILEEIEVWDGIFYASYFGLYLVCNRLCKGKKSEDFSALGTRILTLYTDREQFQIILKLYIYIVYINGSEML
jgi:hypothetical protein